MAQTYALFVFEMVGYQEEGVLRKIRMCGCHDRPVWLVPKCHAAHQHRFLGWGVLPDIELVFLIIRHQIYRVVELGGDTVRASSGIYAKVTNPCKTHEYHQT